MDFNHFLSAYYPDPSYGGDRLYADMVEQAKAAERLGYNSVSIPEHHIINILLNPAPLHFAVKLACETETMDIVTSVAVLPLHDMRVFAGEVAMTDILTDGRLVLGVGRGAFDYEMSRLGTPLAESRAKFDESLDVLLALLTETEVEWHGNHYDFDPITIMPRPITRPRPRMMIATMNAEGIRASTLRGFNIQTTALAGSPEMFRMQIGAHKEAKAEMGEAGADLRIMTSRIAYCAENAADARRKLEMAYDYYCRFDNVFVGPGVVENGCIAALPREQSIEELNENLLICTAEEMVDQLADYHELGVDEVIFSSNIGQSQAEMNDMMERVAADVIPHFNR